MPSAYAHFRFGRTLADQLPGDLRRTVQRFPGLFDMGLHGPDIFYYHSPLLKTDAGFLGIKFHEQTGRDFFTRVCRAVRLEKSEGAMAYLYGLLCHYCLDSICHPFVQAQETAAHLECESEFDRYLLELDGKPPEAARELAQHMKLTQGECETVAKFYPPASAGSIRSSVRNMAFFTKLLASPGGAKRTVLENSVALVDKKLRWMLIPLSPNPRCQELNSRLLELYQQAMTQFPDMLFQLQAHMTYNAPLGEEFSRSFG